MRVGVIAELVTLRHEPTASLGSGFEITARDEERRMNTPTPKGAEHVVQTRRDRAVIKGEGDHAFGGSHVASCIRLQVLPETPNQANSGEPKGPMSGRARLVLRFRVGSELDAALRTRPGFRGDDQLSADAVAPCEGFDEPALEVAHSIGSTTLGVRANGNLGEGRQTGSRTP